MLSGIDVSMLVLRGLAFFQTSLGRARVAFLLPIRGGRWQKADTRDEVCRLRSDFCQMQLPRFFSKFCGFLLTGAADRGGQAEAEPAHSRPHPLRRSHLSSLAAFHASCTVSSFPVFHRGTSKCPHLGDLFVLCIATRCYRMHQALSRASTAQSD